MGPRQLLSGLIAVIPEALASSMLLVLLYSVLVMVLRRGRAAGVALIALFTTPLVLQMRATPLEVALLLIAVGLLVVVFVRVGLLALASYGFFDTALSRFPLALTGDWRSEFAVMTLLLSTSVIAAAADASMRPTPVREVPVEPRNLDSPSDFCKTGARRF